MHEGGNHRVRQAPQPHLERLVTGSRITMHSFTSPYLQKYSFRPSEAQEQQVQTPLQHQSPAQQRRKELSKQSGIFTGDRESKGTTKSSWSPPDAGSVRDKRGFTLCCLPAESTYEHFTAGGKQRIKRSQSGTLTRAGLRNEQRLPGRAQRCGRAERRCVNLPLFGN